MGTTFIIFAIIVGAIMLQLKYNIIHIHDWYYGCKRMYNFKSKWTSDLIGRSERSCLECDRKQINVGQFTTAGLIRYTIESKLGKRKNGWYTYKRGDWLDQFTMYHCCATSIPDEQQDQLFELCKDVL